MDFETTKRVLAALEREGVEYVVVGGVGVNLHGLPRATGRPPSCRSRSPGPGRPTARARYFTFSSRITQESPTQYAPNGGALGVEPGLPWRVTADSS